MVRAKSFVFALAFSLMPFATPGCFAQEQRSEQAAPKPAPQKPAGRTRSFQVEEGRDVTSPALRPRSAPAPSNSGGDGARPDDTVGGLPGHSAAPAAKQP